MIATRVLVVTGDTLGASMAGPAIRAFEISKALADANEVRLVSTVFAGTKHANFAISMVNRAQLREEVKWAEVIIFQGSLLSTEPWIGKTNKILIADLYDPIHIESLEQQRKLAPILRYLRTLDINSDVNHQLRRGDYFICASEKQRDLWLGQLAAVGRLNTDTYDRDSSLRRLIDVVPFGVQDEPPVQTERHIRDKMPGISAADKIMVWGGGVYNWFDPLTLIRAVKRVSQAHDNLRLVFMGTKHPNPLVPEMKMLVDAQELTKELGLLDKHVFFNEGWVPYEERANVLLDADLGVSTHLDHLETAFSFRTRILDYLWAGLPIIATRGDIFESIIESHHLGAVVNPGDVEGLSIAIEELLYDDEVLAKTAERVHHFADHYHWNRTLRPLIEFVSTATRAADSESKFPALLTKFDKSNPGRLRRRLLLYTVSIRRFGFWATVKSIAGNLKKRFSRSAKSRP